MTSQAYGRLNELQGKQAKIRIELVDDNDVPMAKQTITWPRTTNGTNTLRPLLPTRRCRKVCSASSSKAVVLVDLDYVSLFPEDNWHGLRADLVKDLEDLHPGIFRFPGGCIVEGTDLATRYQWKNSVAIRRTVR